MRPNNLFRVAAQVFLLLFFAFLLASSPARAQDSNPDRDQLLNGLKVVYLPQPGNGKLSLQLRIHSGAAFDPAGKSGLMAIVGDSLFPEAESKLFFEEELGGSLTVTTDYDSINVTMTGNATEAGRMLDALRAAVVDNPMTKETIAKLQAERISTAKSISPADLADELIAERLLGQFPYGRPVAGTPESLGRIDRPDLTFARDRFMNPNNATLIIGGTFDRTRIARLLRQNLGVWRKSDTVVPSTFRQPDDPDPRVQIVERAGPGTEVRLAVRGVARSDQDYPTALVLGVLSADRLRSSTGAAVRFARFETHVLPGLVVLGGRVDDDSAGAALNTMWDQAIKPFVDAAPSAADLAAAKIKAKAILDARRGTGPGAGGLWLDADTFGLSEPAKQLGALDAVTAADVQRVAIRLFKTAPVARVALGDAPSLKTAVEKAGFRTELAAPQSIAPAPVGAGTQTGASRP